MAHSERLFSLFSVIVTILLLLSCTRDRSTIVHGYIEGRFTYLASSVPGHLKQRFVHRGQEVAQGDKLFVLDLLPESAQLEQAQNSLIAEKEKLINLKTGSRSTVLDAIHAELDQAKSALALATLTRDRREKLVKNGAISQSSYDDAVSDYQVKQKAVVKLESDLAEAQLGDREHIVREQVARVQVAEAQIKEFQWRLSQKTGWAPVNGLVFDTFFRAGEFVPAEQAILALLAPSNIYLIFFVPEPLLSTIKVGQAVSFTCDGCTKQTATLSFISPAAEYTPPVIFTKESRQKLVYRVEARIPLDQAIHLHPGQPVDIVLLQSASPSSQ